ncbi:MAG: hypothetical protein ABR532_02595 [Candidatus Dormibacteria bacterium]
MYLISSFVVDPALSPVASINISNPAGFRHITAFWKGASSAAVTNQGLQAQFNGDTGANYYWEPLDAINTAIGAVASAGDTSMRAGIIPGSSATAGMVGGGRIDIPFAGDIYYKMLLALSGGPTTLTAAGQSLETSMAFWAAADPVTSMLLFPAAGGFVTGFGIDVYGLV